MEAVATGEEDSECGGGGCGDGAHGDGESVERANVEHESAAGEREDGVSAEHEDGGHEGCDHGPSSCVHGERTLRCPRDWPSSWQPSHKWKRSAEERSSGCRARLL